MTGKLHLAQNESGYFTFNDLKQVETIIARYPKGFQQSAVMPLLTLAQEQCGGWLPKAAMDGVAGILGMAPVRVYEVASFYTMYNLNPTGQKIIEICTTTPCWLRGSDEIVEACERRLGISLGETTPDGQFTLREVECLGACVNAPMCGIGEHYYEDLTPQSMVKIIDKLAFGEEPTPGPQSGRTSSEPATSESKNV